MAIDSPKIIVEQLSREGVSLVTMVMNARKYGEVVSVEALRQLHVNVRSLRGYEKV